MAKVTQDPPAKLYARLWVKPLLALFVVIVTALPMNTLEALRVGVDARGIVVSVFVADAVTVPLLRPVTNDAEQLSVFVPSALCATVTVFVIMIWDPLVVLPVLKVKPEKEYAVPLIVRVPVHSPVALKDPPVHFAVTAAVTLEVLFVMLWLFCVIAMLILTAI